MIYEVTTNTHDWKIFPRNEIEEIGQNILMIISTQKYSVPLCRKFGVEFSQLDAPLNAMQAKMTAEIVSSVQEFEPRAKVIEVIYNSPDIAKLDITVRFTVKSTTHV